MNFKSRIIPSSIDNGFLISKEENIYNGNVSIIAKIPFATALHFYPEAYIENEYDCVHETKLECLRYIGRELFNNNLVSKSDEDFYMDAMNAFNLLGFDIERFIQIDFKNRGINLYE